MNNWIILYDIADPKRLSKVAKVLESYAKRVQKSVFELNASTNVLNYLRNKIKKIIVENDIVCYFDVCDKDWQNKEKFGPEDFTDEEIANYYIV